MAKFAENLKGKKTAQAKECSEEYHRMANVVEFQWKGKRGKTVQAKTSSGEFHKLVRK